MGNPQKKSTRSKKFLRGLLLKILVPAFYFLSAHPASAFNDLGLLKDGTTHVIFQTSPHYTFGQDFFFEVESIQTVIDGYITAEFGYVTLSEIRLASITPFPELDLLLLTEFRLPPSNQPKPANSLNIGNLAQSPDSGNFTGKFRLLISGTQHPIAQDLKLTLHVSSVPEPGTLLTFGAGLLLIVASRVISNKDRA